MSVTLQYFLAALVTVALGSPIDGDSLTHKREEKFVWGSVGDSWASGVSYNSLAGTDYDNNKNGCLRWKDSYGPLMERDTTWTKAPQEFHFAACSGAWLVNIYQDAQGENPPQFNQVGDKPKLVTYHAGGNNNDFGWVINDCIYQPDNDFDYGPEYPDPAGVCAERIKHANEHINDESINGFYTQEWNTINDILFKSPAVIGNKDFHLYVLSYVDFFNPSDNYCSTNSFGPFLKRPKLSVKLRTDINAAVIRVNEIMAKAVASFKDPRVKYVDISHVFKGHRFCEDHHSVFDNWWSEDVWLWNANIPLLDTRLDPDNSNAPVFNSKFFDVGKQQDRNAWVKGNVSESLSGPGTHTPIGVEKQGKSPVDVASGPWTFRPFHPKKRATKAIKEIIIAQARADKIPGVIDAVPGATLVVPDPTHAATSKPIAVPTPTASPSGPDINSAVCKECSSTLGASECGAKDQQCLIDQCQKDKDCQECKMDCSTVGFG